jgi:hypothetical protein
LSNDVAIQDAKQLFGTGQARNRTARAVERTIAFMAGNVGCSLRTGVRFLMAGSSDAAEAGRSGSE